MDGLHVVIGRIGPPGKNTGKGSRRNFQPRRKLLLRQAGQLHYLTNSVLHISKKSWATPFFPVAPLAFTKVKQKIRTAKT